MIDLLFSARKLFTTNNSLPTH